MFNFRRFPFGTSQNRLDISENEKSTTPRSGEPRLDGTVQRSNSREQLSNLNEQDSDLQNSNLEDLGSVKNTTDEDPVSGAESSFNEGERSNSEWQKLLSAEVNFDGPNKHNASSEGTSIHKLKSQTDKRSSFYTISERVMYGYSAYYDNRQPHVHPFGLVRVFTMYHVEQVTPNSTLQCQLHYKQKGGRLRSKVWKHMEL